jgi:hypothetical protein
VNYRPQLERLGAVTNTGPDEMPEVVVGNEEDAPLGAGCHRGESTTGEGENACPELGL